MSRRTNGRRPRFWVTGLCTGIALALCTAPAASAAPKNPCATQVNDTPSKLVPCIQTDDLWNHMKAFQAIADANPGPRRASVAQLRRTGLQGVGGLRRQGDEGRRLRRHDPDVQVHLLRLHRHRRRSARSHRPRTTTRSATDWNPGQSTGTANAAVQPAGGIVIPPTPTPSSTSGCTAADFSGFVPGRIALIQRGSVQLRREGAQRPGRGGDRRHHLQRGQPRPHGRC